MDDVFGRCPFIWMSRKYRNSCLLKHEFVYTYYTSTIYELHNIIYFGNAACCHCFMASRHFYVLIYQKWFYLTSPLKIYKYIYYENILVSLISFSNDVHEELQKRRLAQLRFVRSQPMTMEDSPLHIYCAGRKVQNVSAYHFVRVEFWSKAFFPSTSSASC